MISEKLKKNSPETLGRSSGILIRVHSIHCSRHTFSRPLSGPGRDQSADGSL